MKPRILIIDNDRKSLNVAKVLLERVNECQVRIESDPQAAVRVACEFCPDIVMIDFEMPEMDGSEVACALRSEPAFAKLPILFLSSTFAPAEASGGDSDYDGAAVIAKPFNPRKLCSSIDRILRTNGLACPTLAGLRLKQRLGMN
jgi:CheY-like chemotaxis protein